MTTVTPDVIDLLDSDSEDEAAAVPCKKRVRQTTYEDDDEVVCTRVDVATPAAAAAAQAACTAGDDDEVVEVSKCDLSQRSKDALLKKVMQENRAMVAKMASFAARQSAARSAPASARPGYWRRDGEGARLADAVNRAGGPARMVALPAGSSEYQSVVSRFLGAGIGDATVVAVHRVHNDELWDAYAARRMRMALRLGSGDAEPHFQHDVLPGVAAEQHGAPSFRNPARERYLFHGASRSTIETIIETGVDFRLSQPTGAMGACAYFADQSAYSHNYCMMPDHSVEAAHRGRAQQLHAGAGAANSSLKMLVCRVLLGTCGLGASGLRRPPSDHAGGLHDSVSNNPNEVANYASSGYMFGVFDNAQVYPEYAIEYTKPHPQHHAHHRHATAAASAAASAFSALRAAVAGGAGPSAAQAAMAAEYVRQSAAAARKKPARKPPKSRKR